MISTKHLTLFFYASLISVFAFAQGPHNTGTYYKNADGQKGAALKSALYAIISSHKNLGYNNLEDYYPQTDKTSDGYMWDMYSVKKKWTYGQSHGGNASEGAGWNKEHSVPQSWFNEQATIKADIMHVIPTDSYVNNRRGNVPFGETKNPQWSSYNGFSKLGDCDKSLGYNGTIFEPNDEYKGDFARIYFYMVTCYENSVTTWASHNVGSHCFAKDKYNCFTDWFLKMLLRWSENDPVSQKEIDRNNAVYKCQGNRNPFVDYPQLEQYIWGKTTTKAFSYDHYDGPTPIVVPDVPYAVDATGISENGFTANWEYAENANTYSVELTEMSMGTTEDRTVLVETFEKCDGSGSVENDECNSYMDNKGWTGSGLFPDKKKLRMSSAKKASSLISPLLNNPNGHVIVKFTEGKYNTDATTITVCVMDANETVRDKKNVTASDSTHIITFEGVNYDYKISFNSEKSQRYYMFDIEFVAGGGTATVVKVFDDIYDLNYTFTGLDLMNNKYSYRVKGANAEASSEWSNSISVVLPAGIEEIESQSTVNSQQSTAVYLLNGQRTTTNSLQKGQLYIKDRRKHILR